jgi:hypothetical protein
MKERPILFSAPMVRAILECRKTQTRRVVKDVPEWCREWGYTAFTPSGFISARGPVEDNIGEKFFRLKYGATGDRLWVRETHARAGCKSNCGHLGCHTIYRADDKAALGAYGAVKWTPAIHIPRWASRITLEITGVRVERLRDISYGDAQAEGWPPGDEFDPVTWYSVLWRDINGAESWAANPWVWVIEFKRVKP